MLHLLTGLIPSRQEEEVIFDLLTIAVCRYAEKAPELKAVVWGEDDVMEAINEVCGMCDSFHSLKDASIQWMHENCDRVERVDYNDGIPLGFFGMGD